MLNILLATFPRYIASLENLILSARIYDAREINLSG